MTCENCGNTFGFVFGACIDCGWNYLTHKYEHVTIQTEILAQVVSPEVMAALVERHDRGYKIRRRELDRMAREG